MCLLSETAQQRHLQGASSQSLLSDLLHQTLWLTYLFLINFLIIISFPQTTVHIHDEIISGTCVERRFNVVFVPV